MFSQWIQNSNFENEEIFKKQLKAAIVEFDKHNFPRPCLNCHKLISCPGMLFQNRPSWLIWSLLKNIPDHNCRCIASLEFQTWVGNPELVKLNLGVISKIYWDFWKMANSHFTGFIGASGHNARSIANSARDAKETGFGLDFLF